MAFTKITNQELNSRGATTLPNQPKISATALKQEFDAPAKNIVAPKFNNLIDELEATTAAASLGAVAPTGRTGETVQAVIDDISDDLATLEESAGPAIAEAHTHPNKELLDTYTQTEEALASAVADDHTHANKSTLDKFSESGGVPYYDGNPIGGGGQGYMPVAVYDSATEVAAAGGIPDYVAANAMQTNGSNAALEVKFDGSFTVGSRAFDSTVGTVSVSEGSLNTASGSYSHAEGSSTTASDGSAHAEGSGTTASGHAAHAEGWNTVASGDAAHAEGYYNTTASGDYAHAEGRTTTASGAASHTEGHQTSATQIYAHAEGSYTTASNDSAHAEGRGTTASGQYSHAGGYYTTAGYSYQTAIGYYNSNKSTNVFEVGNGTDIDNKRNAFEVRKNGDVNIQGQILRNGAPEYLEDDNVTLSTSTTTTVTFTNAAITANSLIQYACTQWDIVPDDITASAGTCTVTMPKVDTAVTVGVRIYLR